ncbi:low temperature requirement protein A [Dactylosporangium sp. NPDC051541]|uniref:low temperature requirement protein A n=1 Tax=Dactylosporangium sp. NPDC051541 TaxID=3363977 RepID=UPI00378DCAD8
MADEPERPAPLVRPPELRVEGERSASRLELFFDLAYLLVVAELATALAEDLTWAGAAAFAGLFTVTWWSWVTTTLYANRFDTNDVIYRLAKLGTAAAVVGMAASARDAVGGKAVTFALCYLGTRLLLLALYARAYRHVADARATIRIYLAGVGAGAALWAASIAVEGPARYALWAAGIVAEAVAPILATRFGGGVPLHVEHLPERFGLFVMLVLGESIMSLAAGIHETDWHAEALWPAAIAFLAIAATWWNYFDLGGAAGKRRLESDGDEQESWVPDAYIYGHLPLTLGLAVFAVGVEEYIVHPGDGAPWALHGGMGLFLAGTAAVVAGTNGHWRAAWPWPAAALPVVAAVGVIDGAAGVLPPPIALGLTGAVVVATVLAGIRQQRRGRLQTAET